LKPTDYEFCYRNRRAVVTSSAEGLRVAWLRDGVELGWTSTLSDRHAQQMASGWAWHGIAPRSAQTLRGLHAVQVMP
jgi:hypothetical protein